MSNVTNAAPQEGAAKEIAAPATAAPNAPAPSPCPPPSTTAAVRKTVEQWQAEKIIVPWLFAFASTQNRWPVGRELTEAEFDAAIKAAFDVAFR